MTARKTHFSAAASVGKWPRALTARRIRALIDSIVILSRWWGVLDVVDERRRSRILAGGRGYLLSSSTRCLGRFGACSAGGDAVVAA
ncbi:MAG: hypothetical protein ACRDRW_15545 [Pseudonocardiaceae bacterium]